MPGLFMLHARVRPSLSSSLDVAGADTGGQPPRALSGALVRESGAPLQPRSRIGHQHAALVSGLGCVVLARPSPLCPALVSIPASCSMKGHAPDPVVRRCHHALYWPVPNDAGGRQQDPARLAEAYRDSESLVLTIDGLQPEKGHETLSVVRELQSKRVWCAEPLLSSAEPEVRRLIVLARQWAERLA